MEQLNKLEWKQIRKYKKAVNSINKICKDNQSLNKTPCFNNSIERRQWQTTQIKRKLYTPTGHQSIRKVKQTVIITKNETNSMNV